MSRFGLGFVAAGTLLEPWRLDAAEYDGKSLVATSQDAFAISETGTKLYLLLDAGGTETLSQYTLSTPWDISTGTSDGVSIDIGEFAFEDAPTDIQFKPDGTSLFYCGSGADRIAQLDLSTPWDISTASYVGFFDTDNTPPIARQMHMSPNGTKLYLLGSDELVHQFTLSTPWSITSCTRDAATFDTERSYFSTDQGLAFKSDGSLMYLIDSTDSVLQYSLDTPWDVSTAEYDSVSFSIASVVGSGFCLRFGKEGRKMYVLGGSIYQFSVEGEPA